MSSVPSTVEAALASVASWKDSVLSENTAKLTEVDAEIAKLHTKLASLKDQLESLEAAKVQLQAVDVSSSLLSKSYEVVFAALQGQAETVGARAAEAAAMEEARRAQVFASMSAGELAPLVQEYQQFKTTVAPTLAALPESYRAAISKHHDGISEQIRAHLHTQLSTPVQVEAEPVDVEVVFGVDAPEGNPEVLICVLPVPEAALTEWSDRPHDLATMFGARVGQAIFETTKQTGPQGAQAICGGHQGLLAIEVDLDGATPDFVARFADTLAVVFGAAPEMAAAKVQVHVRPVEFDYLLPPETDDAHAEEA